MGFKFMTFLYCYYGVKHNYFLTYWLCEPIYRKTLAFFCNYFLNYKFDSERLLKMLNSMSNLGKYFGHIHMSFTLKHNP